MSPAVIRASDGRGAAQAFFIAGGEGEPGAGGGELAGAGGADALGGSRDEHHFAVNSHGLARRLPMSAQKRHNGTMPKRLIPLFPLQLVVFPRTQLPLHIFEERYKEMVGDAIRDELGIRHRTS